MKAGQDSWLLFRDAAFAAVSTLGLFSVTATVCSKCADFIPSTVTTVHRSGIVLISGSPTFTIGSIAIVKPSPSLIPRFGLMKARYQGIAQVATPDLSN